MSEVRVSGYIPEPSLDLGRWEKDALLEGKIEFNPLSEIYSDMSEREWQFDDYEFLEDEDWGDFQSYLEDQPELQLNALKENNNIEVDFEQDYSDRKDRVISYDIYIEIDLQPIYERFCREREAELEQE